MFKSGQLKSGQVNPNITGFKKSKLNFHSDIFQESTICMFLKLKSVSWRDKKYGLTGSWCRLRTCITPSSVHMVFLLRKSAGKYETHSCTSRSNFLRRQLQGGGGREGVARDITVAKLDNCVRMLSVSSSILGKFRNGVLRSVSVRVSSARIDSSEIFLEVSVMDELWTTVSSGAGCTSISLKNLPLLRYSVGIVLCESLLIRSLSVLLTEYDWFESFAVCFPWERFLQWGHEWSVSSDWSLIDDSFSMVAWCSFVRSCFELIKSLDASRKVCVDDVCKERVLYLLVLNEINLCITYFKLEPCAYFLWKKTPPQRKSYYKSRGEVYQYHIFR